MSNTCFVFGSNEAGIHGGGAARYAFDRLEAIWGQETGPQGQCYAIPTKDRQLRTLPLIAIASYVGGFLHYAELHPDTVFHVTQIGCGLAGLEAKDISPMFLDAPDNCQFSSGWSQWLAGRVYWTDL